MTHCNVSRRHLGPCVKLHSLLCLLVCFSSALQHLLAVSRVVACVILLSYQLFYGSSGTMGVWSRSRVTATPC